LTLVKSFTDSRTVFDPQAACLRNDDPTTKDSEDRRKNPITLGFNLRVLCDSPLARRCLRDEARRWTRENTSG
jgi:hypothetical protein